MIITKVRQEGNIDSEYSVLICGSKSANRIEICGLVEEIMKSISPISEESLLELAVLQRAKIPHNRRSLPPDQPWML